MSEKFKKHIIENLQPPLVYNLIQLGLPYDKKTYEYFISKYFNIDIENIKIDYDGPEDNYEMIIYTLLPMNDMDEDVVEDIMVVGEEEIISIQEDYYVEKMIYEEIRREKSLIYQTSYYDKNCKQIYYQKVRERIDLILPFKIR